MKFSEYALDRDNAVAFMEEAVAFWDIPIGLLILPSICSLAEIM